MLSLKEQSKEDILTMLNLALKLKELRNKGIHVAPLKDKTLIMFFQKSSTRTRLSFEAGMTELGGHAIFLDAKTTQFALTSYEDEIQCVMRFGHILMHRAVRAKDVEIAASFNRIPCIDACSEKYHPCQALADIQTMAEHSHGIENVKKIVYMGIENNVSNTLMLACVKLGIEVVLCCPEKDVDSIDEELYAQAEATGLVKRTTNLEEALKDADYVHTDTWMNMEFFENGHVKESKRGEYEERKKKFAPFQVNAEIINKYCPKARIMHCMPCHLNYEITKDAVYHPNSVIFDQAENRMHMQKAILMWLLELENTKLQ